ncbi:PIG-L deacetylase family protein [uncultured Marinobacter sp.]|uniref:PIG-L deacetylase family protein n=1 Tax=uncultured Marinobacter sp. TaxID=187379 RepID=UPI00262FFA37|nr:PIG-L deacetylase family protein [uncultured Marinobacter sp.]
MGAVLVVSPHPDDETLGCGGLIGICARAMYPLSVLAMTNGEASHPGNEVWRNALSKIRQREQRNALKALGIPNPDIIQLGLPDGELNQISEARREQTLDLIRDVIRSRNIKSLFLPAIDDRHADHREAAKLLVEAVRSCPVTYVFSYQIWPPATRPRQVSVNERAYTLDVSAVLPAKRTAVEQYRSQLGFTEPTHTEGFRMPQALLDEKLRDQECFALILDLSAWSA